MSSNNSIVAVYASPTGKQPFSSSLPSLPSGSEEGNDVQAKTEYLSALRANVAKTQNDINVFLTEKMEEDKLADAGGAKKQSRQEEKEEEMYGEEDPEQDA